MVIGAEAIFSFRFGSLIKSIEQVGSKEPAASIIHPRGGGGGSNVTSGRF